MAGLRMDSAFPRAASSRRPAGLVLALGLGFSVCAAAQPPDPAVADDGATPPIAVSAPEPRYVAPTQYDRIGRIWVPAMINGQGPFRLVFDTGASQSAVNSGVASALGIDPASVDSVLVSGATGSRVVSRIPIRSIVVGDVDLRDRQLPVVADALGGADGVMGAEGLLDKRIRVDFGQDRISVRISHREQAPAGFLVVPIDVRDGLLFVDGATVGGIRARVVIDTGAQGTIANEALRRAIRRRIRPGDAGRTLITGVTADVQNGDRMIIPEMHLGAMRISPMEVAVGDLYIFQRWNLGHAPAVIVGMDVLGLLDTLIIDYARAEVQVRMR
jgi:predicted aspartyl protease